MAGAEDLHREQRKFLETQLALQATRRQRQLPGIPEHEALEAAKRIAQGSKLMQASLSGDRLYTAQILIMAGLPIRAPQTQTPVKRKARLADGSTVTVTFSPSSDGIPLPYGSDRLMVSFLTNQAVMTQSTVFRWKTVDQFIRMFQLTPHSGGAYRRVQERFIRVAYMNITIEITEPARGGKPGTVSMMAAPLIDGIRLVGVKVDEAGKWEIPETPSEMINNVDLVRVGENFYQHLLNNPRPVPIPMEIYRNKKLRESARLLDYAVFLYYRSFAGAGESLIPWSMLAEGFEAQGRKHMIEDFRAAQAELHTLPPPFDLIRSEPIREGLRVWPTPQGTEFFKGHPKKIGPARSS